MTPALILLDIEGTTSSIDFVHQTLFPYAAERMENFIKSYSEDKEIQDVLEEVEETLEIEGDPHSTIDDLIQGLLGWIESDRKHHGLKKLQGMIWKEGFESGELEAHVYPEVKESLKQWTDRGIELGIYSSGSKQAQKLLFGHTTEGDLGQYISHYFDTAVGHKRESQSYQTIAEQTDYSPGEILFLSDVVAELEAAAREGYETCLIVRPDNKHQTNTNYPHTAQNFNEVTQKFL